MPVELELAPKQKRPAGEPCCAPVVQPDFDREHAERMAVVAKALSDPVRMQLVDVLRRPRARSASASSCGLWAYYYVISDALEDLSAWLS